MWWVGKALTSSTVVASFRAVASSRIFATAAAAAGSVKSQEPSRQTVIVSAFEVEARMTPRNRKLAVVSVVGELICLIPVVF